jgi:hypothetical protein
MPSYLVTKLAEGLDDGEDADLLLDTLITILGAVASKGNEQERRQRFEDVVDRLQEAMGLPQRIR